MNWLQKTSQSKPFPMPVPFPDSGQVGMDIARPGYNIIDNKMRQNIADEEKERFDMKFLGSGSMGTVVDIGGGKVRKYTDREDEILAAKIALETKPECLIPVYSIEQIQNNPNVWAIDMAKAKLLNEEERAEITTVRRRVGWRLWPGQIRSEINREDHTLIQSDYLNLVTKIKDIGLTPSDASQANIGWYGGKLVLFDLGLAHEDNPSYEAQEV